MPPKLYRRFNERVLRHARFVLIKRHPRFQGWHGGSCSIKIAGGSQHFMKRLICQAAGRLLNFVFAAIFVTMALWSANVRTTAETLSSFAGEKTAWHGFDRYDFVMDESTLAIAPFKSPPGEGDGVNSPAKGKRRCIVVVPKQMAAGNPWSWQGCYWNATCRKLRSNCWSVVFA